MAKKGDNADYISASKVLEIYQSTNFGRENLKKALADLLRDGKLHANGLVLGYNESSSIGAAFAWAKTVRPPKDTPLEIISPRVWQKSRRWFRDQECWRWGRGAFSITDRLEPPRRIMIYSVHFSSSELKKFLLPPPKSSGGGKEPSVLQWMDFACAAAAVAKKTDLTIESFPTQKALLEAVVDCMDGDEFGETRMKWAIGQLYNRCIDRYPNACPAADHDD